MSASKPKAGDLIILHYPGAQPFPTSKLGPDGRPIQGIGFTHELEEGAFVEWIKEDAQIVGEEDANVVGFVIEMDRGGRRYECRRYFNQLRGWDVQCAVQRFQSIPGGKAPEAKVN